MLILLLLLLPFILFMIPEHLPRAYRATHGPEAEAFCVASRGLITRTAASSDYPVALTRNPIYVVYTTPLPTTCFWRRATSHWLLSPDVDTLIPRPGQVPVPREVAKALQVVFKMFCHNARQLGRVVGRHASARTLAVDANQFAPADAAAQ